ncbi:hypothetical protein HOY82DRAFT_535229 [Tuber indicum]|nr:hypothetical protein HOY82DRAFT_535229 [Tuber indicum]
MTDKTGIEYAILATDWKSAVWASVISPNGTDNTKVNKYASREDTNAVKYSYNLKNFKESYAGPSNHTVHSAANCSLIEVGEGQYWCWGTGIEPNHFSIGLDWGDEENSELVPQVLRLSNYTMFRQPSEVYWASILDLLNGSRAFPQICRYSLSGLVVSKH